MQYKLNLLKNNLRVLTVPMPSAESLTVTVWVKAGSRQEEDKISGLAHFLEHMAFKGGRKFQTARAISEIVDGMGAVNNAGTSKEWTNFWIKTAVANLERAFEVLSDITLSPLLKQEEIDRERGVIYEELAMYEDTPMMSIGEYFEENLYGKTDLGKKIGGGKESLKNVNHTEFLEFRRKFYIPSEMVVSVSGGTTEKEVMKLADKYFSGIESKSEPKGPTLGIQKTSEFDFKGRTLEAKDRVTLKTKKSDQAHLVFGFPSNGRGYKGRFAQGALVTILGQGMSSRLFTEVRERRGLAYSVRASQERYSDVGSFSVYAGVALEKVDEAIKVIMDQLYGLASKKYPILPKELNKAKNSLKGHIALSLEDSSEVGDFFAEQILFDHEVLTPKDLFTNIEKVTVEEVYGEAAKIFKAKSAFLSLVGPYKEKSRFVKLLK